ncbi:hypothetical protein BPAE_0009g00170 [Botrytis paeoniae]|uniref:Heterokaryon incompatibility domain-containing protein n=1 Tax=Botrytis paeoniae TaxID=278948 RepID=A0A4Z1G3F4_9HELO|nr:hypothetical protein BPAE_0009g00170 [Botrytis paeoniae]
MTSNYHQKYNTGFSCIYFQINYGTAIRLVVIHPGSGGEPIRCHLMHTKLGERNYEALSYEWKEESHDDPRINVNGEDITVRRNLHVALVQLRLSETERHTWIDALSINQSKARERNAQIKIMGQIYSDALRVLVWLGSAAEKSDTALRMLKEVAAQTVLRMTDRKSNEEYSNQLGQLSEGFNHED